MKKLMIILLATGLFQACQNSQKQENPPAAEKNTQKQTGDEIYMKKGKEIAQATFKAFKGHIKKKSHEGGLTAVVDFCHENALKLTDSMAQVYNVKIKRTSHKLRNPENAPDAMEKEILTEYLAEIKQAKKPKPVIKKDDKGNVHFYAPIFIKHDCLKCHGEPVKDIPEPIYKKIKENYPQDKAINFKTGDLRGIWDIEFPQNN